MVTLSKKTNLILIFSLLIIALWVRVYGISKHSTVVDEVTWISQSSIFMKNIYHLKFSPEDWGGNVFLLHPGVITCALCGTSLSIWMLFFSGMDFNSIVHLKTRCVTAPAGASDSNIISFLANLDLSGFLAAARLPFAIVGAISVLILYLLVKRIYNWQVGLISALFLALSPFYIAISRYPITDQALTFFFMTAILLYALAEKENNERLKLLAGVSWGLALLSKSTALIVPFILFIWKLILGWRKEQGIKGIVKSYTLGDIKCFLSGLVVFFLLYPRAWGEFPHLLIKRLFAWIFHNTDPRLICWFGKFTTAPFYYYFVIPPLQLQEVFLISLLVGFLWFIYYLFCRKTLNNNHLLLIIWLLIFVGCMPLMGHKGTSYILPALPALAILGAMGLLKTIKKLFSLKLKEAMVDKTAIIISVLIILIPSLVNLFTYYPNYNSYFNSFVGGYKGAVDKKIILPYYDPGKTMSYIAQFGHNLKIAVVSGNVGHRNITKFHYPGGEVVDTIQSKHIRKKYGILELVSDRKGVDTIKSKWKDSDYLIVPEESRIFPDSPASLYAKKLKPVHVDREMGVEQARIYKLR